MRTFADTDLHVADLDGDGIRLNICDTDAVRTLITETLQPYLVVNAAAACNVTQSTLSAGIHDLENILEVQLFERTKKKVLVTETGQAVIDKARLVIQSTQELVETATDCADDQDLSGNIKLAVIYCAKSLFMWIQHGDYIWITKFC